MPRNILVVDDDANNLSAVAQILEQRGYRVCTSSHPQDAFEAYRRELFDVVVCDLRMPSLSGDQLMELCYRLRPGTPFVFLTAYGSIDQAVTLLKNGAFHFLTKPVKKSNLLAAVEDALQAHDQRRQAALPTASSSTEIAPQIATDPLIGQSPEFKEIIARALKAAQTDASILILGENGSGKEGLAQLIHHHSRRSSAPWVKVNCGAIPETLMESELFGVTRGAYTGATADKKGRIESAHGGTLFLDEVGEISPSVQVKFLQVLQDGVFHRLGDAAERQSDFRLISATHRDLEEAVRLHTFREDLFYRINVVHFCLPPLRKRTEDIPLLTQFFIRELCKKMRREEPQLMSQALDKLLTYTWPGNIRELKNVLEQALVFCGDRIDASDIILRKSAEKTETPGTISVAVGTPLKEIEKRVILDTLEATDYDKELTARLLGTTVRTLYRRFDEWKEETKP